MVRPSLQRPALFAVTVGEVAGPGETVAMPLQYDASTVKFSLAPLWPSAGALEGVTRISTSVVL